MQFEWDSNNWPKCHEHGVSKGEIELVLSSEPMTRADHKHSDEETRFIAVGKAPSGKFVFIVFCVRGGAVRPISARFMRQKEVAKELVSAQQKQQGESHVANHEKKGDRDSGQ